MKHLSLAITLFTLFVLSVLWAQPSADSTVFIKIDTLVAREDFTGIKALIATEKDGVRQSEYWNYFCRQAVKHADVFFEQDSFARTTEVLAQALETLDRAGRSDSLMTARLFVWKAFAHRAQEQYSNVLENYLNALRIYELHRYNHPLVAYAYKNAAQVCTRRQNYTQADHYLLAALKSDSTGSYLLPIYTQLANNAYWEDSLDLALYYYETAKDIPGEPKYRAYHENIGSITLLKKGAYKEAELLCKRALEYLVTNPREGENRIRSYETLAEIANRTHRPELAVSYFQKAETEGKSEFNGGKSREMAKLYTDWGDFLAKQGQTQEALKFYQKAIIQAVPDFNNPDPAANPDPAKAPIELWAMLAPARKAALLLQNPTPELRQSAAECFDMAFTVADRLRRAFGTDDAKIYLAEKNYNIQREAVLNLWALYQQSGDQANLERLFMLLENNRANALRDALHQQRALALSAVPDSLLQQEEASRQEIASLQLSITEQGAKKDTLTIALLERELTRIQLLYDELLQHLKNNYSKFNEFLEAGETADLASIQGALPKNAALLSWFNAGDRYLCLTLGKQQLTAYEVLVDSLLEQTLSSFQSMLANKNSQESAPNTFFSNALFLKKRLLPEDEIPDCSTLIIVPDGRLAYLPFEVLLTQEHQGTFASAPYLLRKYAVQYAWSAALLATKPGEQKTAKQLLQVAPFVDSSRDGLALLPNSLREKPEGVTPDLWQGASALANRFLKSAANYQVVHLSTHAHAGLESEPGIEFFDRTVLLPEIYAQRLHASLVALSACETGAGNYANGEGVLSLARAFAYAGAQSLVASHWSVSERSTADLFAAFYQNLEKGMIKSEALRQAKLQMLEQKGLDARKAPFYWAAFTLSGADGPVKLPQDGVPIWVWGLALLGVGLAIWRLWIFRN